MSQDEDKDKDNKKKENDPYDFFKFSVDPQGSKKSDGPNKNSPKPRMPIWAIILIIFAVSGLLNLFLMNRNDNTIEFSQFKQMIMQGQITKVVITQTYFIGYAPSVVSRNSISSTQSQNPLTQLFSSNKTSGQTQYKTGALLTEGFLKLLDDYKVTYTLQVQQNNALVESLLSWIIPFALIFLMWRFFFKKMGGGIGGGLGGSIFSAGQSRASAVEEGQVTTRFADVAGVDEAKEELVEVVDFLKSPQKYTDIGGKIPKGVLLVGPPGTGKTLLARAVAGEAGVPFFRISGSDFVEMFVGVGASRVRDLFKQAREKAPCIVFIDELDAIGKSRMNSMNSNDEREQTLNQLLVEMDGFDSTKGLILLAATNRPDVLDPALLRPGRFDRQVVVDRPDVKGREAILKIHSKNVKLDKDVNLDAIAHATTGMSGADLANVVNEAALLAVRGGRKLVAMQDFDEAIEKALVGLQKKSRVIKEKERKIVAFHETGHALVAAFTEGAPPVHKISIIPRGMAALGYTLQRAEDESFLSSEKDMIGEIDCLLGGRAAEQITFGEISTGAANDIQRATDIVRKMITTYGMGSKFKNMTLGRSGSRYETSDPVLVREYSEATQQYIDEEISRVIDGRYQRVLDLLTTKKVLVDYIANRLLEKEVMDQAEFNDIVKAESSLAISAPAAETTAADESTSV